tara:strand:+ start:3543 stop:3848 length:306 start_codon:yes stop_codon:yes gene_type:complete
MMQISSPASRPFAQPMNEYGEERRSRHHHSMGGWQETAIANLGKYLRLGTYGPEHEVKLLVRDHVLADRQVAVQPTQFAPLTREDRQRVVKWFGLYHLSLP